MNAMRRIIYNDDSQGVHEVRAGCVREDLEAWVDKPFARIPIDTYAWCIAFPDVCMHATKAGEVYGDRFAEPPNSAAAAIRELREQGTDVLEVVTARAHQHGAEMVASVRMNDTHGMFADRRDPQMSQFLIDHPEWVIKRQDGIPERALDYSFPQVREHRLAILQELAENYDIDGLELDFTRWAKFFPRHEAPFESGIMTEFVGEVRAILDRVARKRGKERLVLGAQVLESLYLCHLSGIDPRAWVEEGWMDFLIQCDFNCTNPQIPVAEFAEFCGKTGCTHHVRMGNMMGGTWNGKPHMSGREVVQYKGNPGYGGLVLTPGEARGTAANAYGFGADGIGLWNICCNLGDRHKAGATGPDRLKFQEDMFAWIGAVSSPEKVRKGRRHYHFVPLYKKATLAVRNYPVNELRASPTGALVQIVTFWANSVGFRQAYRFLMADGQDGEGLEGKLRVRILNSTLADEFALDINGEAISEEKVSREFVSDDELPYVWYEADLQDCPPFAGENELGMTPTLLEGVRRGEAYMEELEMIVE